MKNLLVMIIIPAFLLLPLLSYANDGTPPWIHKLAQKQQDVTVTLAIIDTGEPGLEEAYTVIRKSLDEEAFGRGVQRDVGVGGTQTVG